MPVEVTLNDLIRMGLVEKDETEGSIKKIAKKLIKDKHVVSYRQGQDCLCWRKKPIVTES